MASNRDDLVGGSYIRFEAGRAHDAKRVFQRVYAGALVSLALILADATLPKVGSAFSADYPDLRLVDVNASVVGKQANPDTGDTETIVRVELEYVDQGDTHVEGGSNTAQAVTSFDKDGERIEVEYNGDSYIPEVPVEVPIPWLLIEMTQVIEGSGTIEAHRQSVEGKVNEDTFLGLPPRCWMVMRVQYEKVGEEDLGGIVRHRYRCQYYLEARKPRSAKLTPSGDVTQVAGWDALISYVGSDGVIPADATFVVKEMYTSIQFGGAPGVFGSVEF